MGQYFERVPIFLIGNMKNIKNFFSKSADKVIIMCHNITIL